MKNNKLLPKIINPKTIKVIRNKSEHLKDPIRFPRILEPIEENFTNDYVKMLSSMTKMLQLELIKQVK